MRFYDVVPLPSFQSDVRKCIAFNPARTEAIADAIEAGSLLLRQFPDLGHRLKIDGVWSMTMRSWSIGETGYVIRYRVEHDRQRIVLTRFRHEKQRPLKR